MHKKTEAPTGRWLGVLCLVLGVAIVACHQEPVNPVSSSVKATPERHSTRADSMRVQDDQPPKDSGGRP